MTGTERAHLRIALGLLRRSCFPTGRGTDGRPNQEAPAHDVLGDLAGIEDLVGRWLQVEHHADWMLNERRLSWRVWRARLALYIRAVLRADEAERWDAAWGQWPCPPRWPAQRCSVCREPRFAPDEEPGICKGKPAAWVEPRPLWYDAKAHR